MDDCFVATRRKDYATKQVYHNLWEKARLSWENLCQFMNLIAHLSPIDNKGVLDYNKDIKIENLRIYQYIML